MAVVNLYIGCFNNRGTIDKEEEFYMEMYRMAMIVGKDIKQ